MRLWAISDLHLGAPANREALRALPAFPEDWLILAGDVCEDEALFEEALGFLAGRFARVIWTAGNHELWLTRRHRGGAQTSLAKYAALVEAARRRGVATPEDAYLVWPLTGAVIVPLLTLYDYSFRPPDVPRERVRGWAAEARCVPADEHLIHAAPLSGIEEWCRRRCEATEARLARELPPGAVTVLAGHYPLRQDLVRLPRLPRFAPWCGTRRTEAWHRRFRAVAAVSGHLHLRRTDWRDGTRFEEVSLGYPAQWDRRRGIAAYLRQVLPEPSAA
ncbi:metallophosphoesterase family protein [Crenalkalicoccus roseus]|uniref:metallophosphoesterase family protein n=1 Tax=Crenalkalicoccus roseus TaxID=1485588 RepID=UPI0010809A9E|nr:metallophosphoesterase [Crenalkalicoccus roseus]